MKRILRYAGFSLLVVLAAAQFVQPTTANPGVDPARNLWNEPGVDAQVGDILRRACADCHSHETRWPWYSKISPISWFVADHVVKGRKKLNFSDWSAAAAPDQLEEIYDSVKKNKMPIAGYLLIHHEARLTNAEREVLLAWADGKVARK